MNKTGRLSLKPLKFQEAVTALLKVNPPPKPKRKNAAKKKSRVKRGHP